jgi:hypothetical protein
VRRGGAELVVVDALRNARAGEIAAGDLVAGEKLHVDGVAGALVWTEAAKQARKNRRFDAVGLRARFDAAAYSALLRVAGANLGMTENGESRVYAESVATAFVRDAGVVGLAALLREYPMVARSLRAEMLVEFLWGNEGALREIAEVVAVTVTPGDVFGFERATALMRLVARCDAAAGVLFEVLREWSAVDGEGAARREAVLRELGFSAGGVVRNVASDEAAALRAALDAEGAVVASAVRVGVLSTMTWVAVLEDGAVRLVRYRSETPGGVLQRAEERTYRDVREAVSGARDGAGSFTTDELGTLLVRATGVGGVLDAPKV